MFVPGPGRGNTGKTKDHDGRSFSERGTGPGRGNTLEKMAHDEPSFSEYATALVDANIAPTVDGELLAEKERGPGGNPTGSNQFEKRNSAHDGPSSSEYAAALVDANIAPTTAKRYQDVAALPEPLFDELIASIVDDKKELTTNAVLREAQAYKRQMKASEKQEQPLPVGQYRIWYADPPWSYGNSGVINESDGYGHAERHYPAMTIEQLCEMGEKIKKRCEPDAVLFLWVTSPLLEECFPVIKAWGFKYKTSFVWDKVGHNYGHYNSVRHELLLVCTRGSCTPDAKELIDSVQSIEKSRKHSEKPEEFRAIIDKLYTYGNRIELFSRADVGGWDSWGNEAK